ncbi:hypothetical protein DFJ73DRAFT_772956 [Zopfochytrium polystomum]|nr:hypothetical protein DFJ73DRAFT_772956 [Zopfochytrium polystomum]
MPQGNERIHEVAQTAADVGRALLPNAADKLTGAVKNEKVKTAIKGVADALAEPLEKNLRKHGQAEFSEIAAVAIDGGASLAGVAASNISGKAGASLPLQKVAHDAGESVTTSLLKGKNLHSAASHLDHAIGEEGTKHLAKEAGKVAAERVVPKVAEKAVAPILGSSEAVKDGIAAGYISAADKIGTTAIIKDGTAQIGLKGAPALAGVALTVFAGAAVSSFTKKRLRLTASRGAIDGAKGKKEKHAGQDAAAAIEGGAELAAGTAKAVAKHKGASAHLQKAVYDGTKARVTSPAEKDTLGQTVENLGTEGKRAIVMAAVDVAVKATPHVAGAVAQAVGSEKEAKEEVKKDTVLIVEPIQKILAGIHRDESL